MEGAERLDVAVPGPLIYRPTPQRSLSHPRISTADGVEPDFLQYWLITLVLTVESLQPVFLVIIG